MTLSQERQELLAHVLDHLPLAWDELQRLGDVLADLVQSPTATRTKRGCGIDDALARQMLRQRPARRLAPLEAAHLDLGRCSSHLRRRFRLRGIFFHLRQRQLELFQDRAPLRGLPKLIVAQLGDGIFELLDEQRPVLRLALGSAGTRFRGEQRLACRNDHRVRAGEIGRKQIGARCHAAQKS